MCLTPTSGPGYVKGLGTFTIVRVLHQKFPDEIICMGRCGEKKKRGVELEVGLQYLSSQSQSTGPVLGKTRHSIDKDVKNSSK